MNSPTVSESPLPPERLRIEDSSSLAALIPYLLGFVPESSLVVVTMNERKRVVMSARVDLPPQLPCEGLRQVREDASALAAAGAKAGAIEAVAVLYLTEPLGVRDERWRRIGAAIMGGLTAAGLRSVDVMAVSTDRWWSLQCERPRCCPAEGKVRPAPGTSAAEASAVAAGMVIRGTRADIAQVLKPASSRQRLAVVQALARIEGCTLEPAAALEIVEAAIACGRADPAAEVKLWNAEVIAAVLRSLDHPGVRDACLMRERGPDLAAAIRLWSCLVQRSGDERNARVATLLAAAAYQKGDGALASLAIDHALNADPKNPLARVIEAALIDAVAPETFFAGVAELAARARESLGTPTRRGLQR